MGTYEDALAEWGRHADNALAAEQALVAEWTIRAIAAEDIQLEAEAEAAALGIELEACRAALAECRDPEPVIQTVFGTSRPDYTVGVTLPVPGVRTYLSPGQRPTSVPSSSAIRRAFGQIKQGGTIWFSIKEPAGDWLNSLLLDMARVRPDVEIWATADHEPFDGWYETGRVAEWHRRQDLFEAVVAAHAQVVPITVVEGWHAPSRTRGYYDAMFRSNQRWGVDSYNPGIGSPGAYVSPEECHAERLAYAASRGKLAYVGETGTGQTQNTQAGREGQSQWVADNRAYLNGKVAGAFWWNSGFDGPDGNGCKLTAAELEAWLYGQAP